MLSFFNSFRRFYGFILFLLVILVGTASYSVVSLVQNYRLSNTIMGYFQEQKVYSQRMAFFVEAYARDSTSFETRYTPELFEQTLKAFKENVKKLAKNEHIHLDFLAYNHSFADLAENALLAVSSGREKQEGTRENDNYRDFVQHVNGEVLQVIDREKQRVYGEFHTEFWSDKNTLLICVFGFIFALGLEGILIYLPYSQRMKQRANALDIEQDLLMEKRSEILESEERLSLVIKGIDAGILDWHIDNDELIVSGATYDLLDADYREGEALGLSFLTDRIEESDRMEFDKILQLHLENKGPLDLAVRLRLRDGEMRWVQIKAQARWDAMGQATRLSGAITDITESKTAEDLTRIFVAGIEKSDLPIAIVDMTKFGRDFMYVSPGLCELLGYEHERLISSNLYMLNGPESSMDAIDQTEMIFENEIAGKIEVVHYKGDGSAFLDSMALTPVLDGQGSLIAYISIHEDVSLTALGGSQKCELEQYRHESYGRIASTVLAQIWQAQQGDQTDDEKAYVDNLFSGLTALDLTRHEGLKRVNILDVFGGVAEKAQSLFSKQVKISFSQKEGSDALSEDYIMSMINEEELLQCTTALIDNACEASSVGKKTKTKPKIEIEAAQEQLSISEAKMLNLPISHLHYYIISISDWGEGIGEAAFDTIFDPLFTTRQSRNAAGLGLAGVKMIVESWGGAISVEVDEGRTSFYLYIPTINRAEDQDFHEMSDLLDELNLLDDFDAAC